MEKALDNINFNDYIVVGVSAGPDSMCLLNLLQLKTNKIIVCHINHNVRKESQKEELFLKNYCNTNNLIFESTKIDNYNENNFENEARKKRYSFYEKILKKYNAQYLFLAHHGDDLIETVLMKIARGSNIEGYAGIKERSNFKEYKIIRPLLPYTKEDILNYNKSHNIPYYIDNSNTNIKYTRNRYRKKILPLLKKEDKNIHIKFLKYSKTLDDYDKYIKKLVFEKLDTVFNKNTIYIEELKKLDEFMQKNTLYQILNIIYNNKTDIITEEHINNIIKLVNNNKPNISIDLPQNKILTKEYKKIYITEKKEKTSINEYKIEYNNKINIEEFSIEQIKETEYDGNNICRLNSSEITLPLYFRNKRNGDFIILKGNNKRRKIKDIFIDNKIPTKLRNNYPLLVDSNDNVLWIPNIKKSRFCIKKDENNKNYDIIIKCNEREENYDNK